MSWRFRLRPVLLRTLVIAVKEESQRPCVDAIVRGA